MAWFIALCVLLFIWRVMINHNKLKLLKMRVVNLALYEISEDITYLDSVRDCATRVRFKYDFVHDITEKLSYQNSVAEIVKEISIRKGYDYKQRPLWSVVENAATNYPELCSDW
ncbi:TPA: hypothetical protein ACPVXZ_004724 [Vibrio parahaemolyticus]